MSRLSQPLVRRAASAAAVASMAAGALIASPASASDTAAYSLTDLGFAGTGSIASATGLNDSGTAVGTGRTTAASRPQAGLRWSPAGGAPTVLALLEGSTFARAFDINHDGTAVGEAFNAAGSSVAVRWDEGGAIASVGSLNGAGTGVANDVNSAGVIVGSSYNGTVGRAFRTTSTGVAELPLPDVAAGQSVGATTATAVADNGTIVGWASVAHPADDEHAAAYSVQTPAAWFGDGSRQLLVSPGGHDSSAVATGVSTRNVVVGYSTTAGTDTAARWDNGKITPLPPVEDAAKPGTAWRHSRALAVDGSTAVGYSSKFAGNYSFGGSATIWHDGVAEDLNHVVDVPSGWHLLAATDVNRAGQISGVASVDGATKAFVLTPVAGGHPAATTLVVDPAAKTYGQVSAVTVTADRAVTGAVELFDGVRSLGAQEIVAGVAKFRLAGTALEPGHRTLTAKYAGSATQTAAESSAVVSVRKARSSIKASAARGKIVVDRTRRSVRVRVRADGVVATGRVSVRIGGKRVASAMLHAGTATVRLPAFATTGKKRIHILYTGSTHVRETREHVSVRVRRR